MTKQTEALRMAIEALVHHTEQTRPIEDTNKAIQTCKEALEQPTTEQSSLVQEPVAWVYEWEDEKAVKLTFHPDSKAKVTPLYTHPAPSWQGLSDAEVDDVFNLGHHTFKEFARAIESMLKDKNYDN